jgi:hypothetical protein
LCRLITSIRNIFRNHGHAVQNYNWIAGATYASPKHPKERVLHLGGHLHLGNPVLLELNLKNAIYERVIRVLDETIALPLVRIDGPRAWERRNKKWKNGYGRYGRWGDQRPQPNRFEWRVPSGLWLAHPDFTQAMLGVTKAVTETCYQMMAEEGWSSDWINAPSNRKGFLKTWGALGERRVATIINDADPKAVSSQLLVRSRNKLTNLPNYEKYKSEIDEFNTLVKLKDPRFNLNLKNTWLNGGKLLVKGKEKHA